VFKAVANRPERRTTLQAGRGEIHGSHALLEPVRLVCLTECVEMGDARGERASGPTGSLELGLGVAERRQREIGGRRWCNRRDRRRGRAREGATRVDTGSVRLGRFLRRLGRDDGDKGALLLEEWLDWRLVVMVRESNETRLVVTRWTHHYYDSKSRGGACHRRRYR